MGVPRPGTDLPPPSPELTMIGAHMRAHMATLTPLKRRKYLTALSNVFEEYEAKSRIVRLRGREHDEEVTRCRREAQAWTGAMMAAFFALDVDRAP